MPNYRKKPVEIEAVQYIGNVNGEAGFLDWPKWLSESQVPYSFAPPPEGKWFVFDQGIMIGTLEGHHIGSKDDYIIKGIAGEIYPCKPEIFNKSYEMIVTRDELADLLSWNTDSEDMDGDGPLLDRHDTHDGTWILDGDIYYFEPNKED